MKRIAVYGGTFDPVHLGHLAIAQKLLQVFSLDEVLFIPAHVAPHKRERSVTPALHRYAMLALATAGDARLRISSIELDAPERPYTVDTLSRLQALMNESARLFFVMGADSWAEITTWRQWERVLSLTDQIVVTRPRYDLSVAHVTEAIRERVIDLRELEPQEVSQKIEEGGTPRIYVTDAVMMDVSATMVRRAARENRGDELKGLLPPPVADYIEKYRLYRDQA
jgi:nicotinate-nucleotide adenylyltransferase